MPLETPIRMGPNTYYFRAELWTAEELMRRFGIVVNPDLAAIPLTGEARPSARSDKTRASAPQTQS